MLSPTHPWYHRLKRDYNQEFNPDDFAKQWLIDLHDTDLTKPVIALINGWGAAHQENKWYAKAIASGVASVFAFDSRGQGNSISVGDLDSIQNAIDANRLISHAFSQVDKLASEAGISAGKRILEGHCVGAMTVAALFAGAFPVTSKIDGVIMTSPVSTFDLPLVAKTSYFIPSFVGRWLLRHFSSPLINMMVKGEDSEYSRRKAMMRLHRFDMDAALRQAKQIFWKENVEKLWKHIDLPVLMLVTPNDPLTKIEDSAAVFQELKYPIWVELEAPDHLIMEENIEYISQLVPKFSKDPWGVYEEMRHLRPNS